MTSSSSTVNTISDWCKRSPHATHKCSKGKCEDLIEFNCGDETAYLRWGPCRGLQTRLPKVFVVAWKREVRIKTDRRQTPRRKDKTNKAYSSSCKAHDLPSNVLKERSNTIKTLCSTLQLSDPPIHGELLTKTLVSTVHFPETAAPRGTSDGRHYLA